MGDYTTVPASKTPIVVNPNGDPPNFEGGPTLQPAVLATGVIFIPISMIVVIIRLVMSIRTSKKLYYDDYLCLLGEIFGISYWIVLYYFEAGSFKHAWDVPVSVITPELLKGHAAGQILNGIAHTLIKASIPALFIRLFGTKKWLRITCYCLIAAVVVMYLGPSLSLLAVCTTVRPEDWDIFLLHSCTSSTEPQSIVISAFGVVFDITVVIIPIFITSRLNLEREKKLGLMVVFLIGLLIVAASITGLGYRIALRVDSRDSLWIDASVAITSYMEIFGTAIVSCAPSLRSFWLTYSSDIMKCHRNSSRRKSANSIKAGTVYHDSTYGQGVSSEYSPGSDGFQYPERLYTSTSTQELMDRPIPLSTFQNSIPPKPNISDNVVYLGV